ncbi:response regulator [Vacuolonema iberomarrocanum]|uniref:response regulator n=1 Tax=Vacuolonema iberomarrocanum TaxID=3454632 RepID=UPI001A088E72|nr:response regulator [filamentous cyanobacterium LEGE 07170]
MSETLHLLCVEDSEDDLFLVLRLLRQHDFQLNWEWVQTEGAFREALTRSRWDLIMSDYSLPTFDAPAALRILKESGQDIPFIVISGVIGDETAVRLMRTGAHDYLMKDNLTRLPEAVRREIRDAQIRRANAQTVAELDIARERLNLALDGSGLGLWDWSVQSRTEMLNSRWAEMIGYTLEELEPITVDTWRHYAHPHDVEKALGLMRQHLLRETPAYECELRMRHRDGRWIWVLDQGKVVEWDAEGNPLRMIGTQMDITTRKQTELRLKFQSQLLERIAQAEPLVDIFDLLVHTTEEQLGDGRCAISLYDAESGKLRHGSAPSLQEDYNRAIDGLVVGASAGSCGAAAFYREVVIAVDIATDSRWRGCRDIALAHGLRSCWSAPAVGNDGEVLATFSVYYSDCRTPSNWELETLALAANIVKIAIERDRSTQALADLNRQLETRVARRTDALIKSEAKLQAILNFAPAIVYVKDQHGRYSFVNEAFLTFFQCSLIDILGQTDQDFFSPEIANKLMANDQIVLETQAFRQYEEAITVGDRTHTFLSNKFVLLDVNGIPYALCGISTDITERKIFQNVLQRGEKRTRATLEAIPDLVFRLNRDGKYIDIVPSPQVICLVDPTHDIGKSVDEVLSSDLAQRYRHAIERAIATQTLQSYEQQIVVDGQTYYEEVRVSPCSRDEVVVLVRDISDREAAAAALRQSEARFQRIAGNVPGVLYQLVLHPDQTYEFTYVSDRCQSILELSAETIQKQPSQLLRLLDADDNITSLEDSIRHSAQVLEQWSWEGQLTTPSGKKLWIQGISQPERQDNGDILWDGLLIDVSDRKYIESKLQQTISELAHATRLKDEFLANMSHELRTPLNAILGMSEAMMDQVFGSLNEQQSHAIDIVAKSGKHLLALINDILDLSKIEAGKLELCLAKVPIVNLCDTSLTFVQQAAYSKQIQLKMDIPPELTHFPLQVDDRRICQVLINLLSNAVKFTPNGGQVTLRVWLGQMPPCSACSEEGNPAIYFSVTDTGIGIAPEDIGKLFQSFVQIDSSLNRKYEGTGLGLALVRQLTEMHGGCVEVTSTVGEGSQFTVCLPCADEAPSAPVVAYQQPEIASPAIAKKTELLDDETREPLILLAEDNEVNILTTVSYLNAKRFRTILAHDGHEAIALAQTHHPDLILMDIQMPGMNGLDAIRAIRQQAELKEIPIIALTALAMAGDREHCLAAGANEYLTKPVQLKQLAATIQQFLKV